MASRTGFDTGLFFVLFYLYVWLVIDPRLIHHTIGIVTPYHPFSFTTGWPFLREHLTMPGGAAEYGTRYLTALYSVGWLGSLIVTVTTWFTCLGIDVLTRQAGQPRGTVVRYVPAILMLVIYSGNGHPLRSTLSLLLVLFCFVVYLRSAARGAAKASVSLTVICVAAYYVAGAGSLLLPVMVAINEALISKRKLVTLAAVLCGLGVPWLVGKTLFGLTLGEAYGSSLIGEFGELATSTGRCTLALYLCFPTVLAVTVLRRAVLVRRASRESDPTTSETASSSDAMEFLDSSPGENRDGT